MRIVLDANIIIASLLGSRGKLIILTSQNHKFYAPRKIIDEIIKYKKDICSRISCSSEDFDANFDALLYFIEIIEYRLYEEYVEKAKIAIKERDINDADYIACTLAVHADFIWTDDKDFSDQELVKVKTTGQFIEEKR